MGIIDDIAAETNYKGAGAAQPEYRPSSYNPLISIPENIMHALRESGASIGAGASELGEGRIAKGLWDVGMGTLGGVFSPLTGAVQAATYPIADVTGIPEWPMTMLGSMVAPGAAARGLGMLGRGGRAAEAAGAAAPLAAEAGPPKFTMPPMESSYTPPPAFSTRAMAEGPLQEMRREIPKGDKRPESERARWQRQAELRKEDWKKYGGLQTEMRYETPGYFDPPTPVEPMTAPPHWVKPEMSGPAGLLEYKPAMPDLRPKWSTPGYESGIPMPGLPQWQRPGAMPAEEAMFGGRRMFPGQQLPDYSMESFARAATERAKGMRSEDEAFRELLGRAGPQTSRQPPLPTAKVPEFAPERPPLQDLPTERKPRQIAKRDPRPSELLKREKRAEEMRGSAKGARAASTDIEALTSEIKPGRALTTAELNKLQGADMKGIFDALIKSGRIRKVQNEDGSIIYYLSME